jgi:predicted Zn-dependent peptidase
MRRLSRKFIIRITLLGLAAATAATALAETRIKDNLKFFTLKNGMHVFVYPRKTAPVFCGMMYVDAGSAEEQVGNTGLAHMLEHMAFKGTPWIGTRNWSKERPILEKIEKVGVALNAARREAEPDKGKIESLSKQLAGLQKEESQYIIPNEYDQIITREGGQEVNASTDVDYTNYFMTLPANKLELWAMMESERMLYPSWREFYQERDVVAEERRMRTEDSPVGRMYEQFIATAFHAQSYRNPTIGWMSDIYNLNMHKINDFYRKWYVPENFVAVLVGDVDPDQAKAVMEKYFGTIPYRKSPPRASTREPVQQGERRVEIKFDAEPQVMIGWHKPTFPDPDMYAFEVIQYILTETGRSSRLYERLVKNDGLCQQVDSFTAPGDKYPNLLAIYATPRAPHGVGEAEKAIYQEIDRLKKEPVSEEELTRVRNKIDSNFISELNTNRGFAQRLGYYYIASHDPNILDTMRDKMKKVSAQDIMRVAQKYLTEDNRTVAEIVTEKPTDAAPPAEPKKPIELSENTAATSGTNEMTSSTTEKASQ